MMHFAGRGQFELHVNGEPWKVSTRPADTLLHVLREHFGLSGAKPGCENGDCGACTVMVDGEPIKSCLMLAVEAVGKEAVTVEGLEGAPAQHAFLEAWAFQCGYCTPGFIMATHALTASRPDADEATVVDRLRSNICRCTGYEEIRAAALKALPSRPPL